MANQRPKRLTAKVSNYAAASSEDEDEADAPPTLSTSPVPVLSTAAALAKLATFRVPHGLQILPCSDLKCKAVLCRSINTIEQCLAFAFSDEMAAAIVEDLSQLDQDDMAGVEALGTLYHGEFLGAIANRFNQARSNSSSPRPGGSRPGSPTPYSRSSPRGSGSGGSVRRVLEGDAYQDEGMDNRNRLFHKCFTPFTALPRRCAATTARDHSDGVGVFRRTLHASHIIPFSLRHNGKDLLKRFCSQETMALIEDSNVFTRNYMWLEAGLHFSFDNLLFSAEYTNGVCVLREVQAGFFDVEMGFRPAVLDTRGASVPLRDGLPLHLPEDVNLTPHPAFLKIHLCVARVLNAIGRGDKGFGCEEEDGDEGDGMMNEEADAEERDSAAWKIQLMFRNSSATLCGDIGPLA